MVGYIIKYPRLAIFIRAEGPPDDSPCFVCFWNGAVLSEDAGKWGRGQSKEWTELEETVAGGTSRKNSNGKR